MEYKLDVKGEKVGEGGNKRPETSRRRAADAAMSSSNKTSENKTKGNRKSFCFYHVLV